METEPVTMGGDPARGDPLPLSRAQRKEGRKEGDGERRRALEKRYTAAVAAMASALCTFSLPSSSLSCSNQAGVSSFSSRCSDVLGDGSRPFHQLGCQTELADSTAGIVAQPRASKSPHSSPFFFFFFPLLPSCERYIPCVSPVVPKGIRVWHAFALRFVSFFVLELMCGCEVLGGCGQKPKQVGCVI